MYADDKSSEAAIVEKINSGDSAGLKMAYDRYGKIAFSLLVRITHDAGVAEDLCQELFLRVWNRISDFDGTRGSLDVWVLAIARNMAIDYVRSSHSRFVARTRPLDQTDHGSISYKPNEVDNNLDNSKTIQEAFLNLNLNQRRVLEMAYFEGFSQSEISRRLGEPLGTIKSWMRSALNRLRLTLEKGHSK